MSSDERERDRVARDFDEAEMAAVERWSDAIDAAARGTLDAASMAELEREAATNDWLREALADARAVRRAADAMPGFTAPAELDTKILAAIDGPSRSVRRASAPAPKRTLRWMATAALAAAVAFVVFLGPSAPQSPVAYVAADGTTYTENEVRAAVEEMETALAMLNGELERSSSIMRREIRTEFHDHVTEPVQRSFGRTVDSIPYLRPAAQENEHSGALSPPFRERPLRSHALPGAFHAERT